MSLIARNRNFRLLFSAAAVSNLGDGIAMLAFPWLATLITRDATLIALVAAATRLPWLLFSLPAGVITDQFDRRRLMVQADVFRMLLTVGVVGLVLSAPALPLADGSSQVLPLIAGLCAAAFLLGSAEAQRLRSMASISRLPASSPAFVKRAKPKQPARRQVIKFGRPAPKRTSKHSSSRTRPNRLMRDIRHGFSATCLA